MNRTTLKPSYRFRVWRVGSKWAAHATSPSEWFREYGFETEADATAWGEDAIAEFKRNDEALEARRV